MYNDENKNQLTSFYSFWKEAYGENNNYTNNNNNEDDDRYREFHLNKKIS